MFLNFRRQIHCWGGLGSQLYAISLGIDLSKSFRNIELVFHNGGVTKRELEAAEFIKNFFPYKTIDDFVYLSNTYSPKKTFKKYLKSIFAKFLKFVRIISNSNTDEEFTKIRFWTMVLRGHYSYRKQNFESIISIRQSLKNTYSNYVEAVPIVVHYRLDDIMNMPGKTVISSSRVCDAILNLNSNETMRVYSDSPKQASEELKSFLKDFSISDSPTESLIVNAIAADKFIGTVSKVSFWIVFFRLSENILSYNALPFESMPHIESALGNINKFKNLSFY